MIHVVDAGILTYQTAWDMQLQLHEQVLTGIHPRGALMLVEHPPVITIGRRTDAQKNLLASPKMLAARGVEICETDRGGDITFHGPGQLVAYPIMPLNAYNFNLHSYMRFLEEVVIQTLSAFQINALRDPSPKPATGVWVNDPRPAAQRSADGLAKICALGIKVRRWVTLHGIALNVSTDLSYFDLINPCGLSRPVTSMQKLLEDASPSMNIVKEHFIAAFGRVLSKPGPA
jgi:lipoate-protein ligase B